MGNKAGFTLVELITVLVLVGIIALFSSMFLISGADSFFLSRTNSQTALKAGIALNRIGLELKGITDVVIQPGVSVAYKNDSPSLPGSRKISFGSGDRIVLTVDGRDYTLLDNITLPTLSVSYADIDGDGNADDISGVEIGFTVNINGVSKKFNTRNYTR